MPDLVGFVLLFVAVGAGFILANLLVGRLIRPNRPAADKSAIYECGEPTIGSAWVQFDLRFYVVALLFVIFDVEMAFFFPWAVVFGQATALADPGLPAARLAELTPGPGAVAPAPGAAARQFAWLAFGDVLVFFGVLLVGFAYLWRRGDLDWVRSLAAQAKATGPRAREELDSWVGSKDGLKKA